jgi:hypothetical protein
MLRCLRVSHEHIHTADREGNKALEWARTEHAGSPLASSRTELAVANLPPGDDHAGARSNARDWIRRLGT